MVGRRLAPLAAAAVAIGILALAPAEAGRSVSAETDEWTIGLYALEGRSLCIGESVAVTGAWMANPAANDGLAPLTGPAIDVAATGGTVTPTRVFTGAASGTFTFTFRAEAAGNARISAVVPNDASAGFSIPVRESCEYRYRFDLDWAGRFAWPGGDKIGFGFQMHSAGTLKATDPSRPRHLENLLRSLNGVFEVEEFQVEGCRLDTPVLGRATGILDVVADPAGDDGDIVVVVRPPEFQTRWYEAFTCRIDSEERTIAKLGSLSLEPASDPWISVTFPSSGGVRSVRVDAADRWTRNVTRAGNESAYAATLTLERIDP